MEKCSRGAPPIYLHRRSRHIVIQGCCNDWLCPRCGLIRANQEYEKIVYGAQDLEKSGHKLYFITITCRGREIPLHMADRHYYKWTTKLLNAFRNQCRRSDEKWAYCQVTERQERGHPHSHLISTYAPTDGMLTKNRSGHEIIVSKWFAERCQSAGLGRYYDITPIRSSVRVSAYIAKYLYKAAVKTEWPKGWRRVRYSRGWPRKPKAGDFEGFALIHYCDWLALERMNVKITTSSSEVLELAKARGIGCINLSIGRD